MSLLSHKARALLARTAPMDEPRPEDRERLRRVIARGMAGAAGAAVAEASAKGAASAAAGVPVSNALPASTASIASAGAKVGTAGVAAKAGLALGAKVAATVFILSSAAVTTAVAVTHREARTPALSASASSAVAPPSVADEPESRPLVPPRTGPLPDPRPLPPAAPASTIAQSAPQLIRSPASAPTAAPAAATAAPTREAEAIAARSAEDDDSLTAEVRLLQDAQMALTHRESERALALLDEHARDFPRGALAEERDAARVLALCASGRTADGVAARAAFLAAHPTSPEADRVRRACDANPTGPQ